MPLIEKKNIHTQKNNWVIKLQDFKLIWKKKPNDSSGIFLKCQQNNCKTIVQFVCLLNESFLIDIMSWPLQP